MNKCPYFENISECPFSEDNICIQDKNCESNIHWMKERDISIIENAYINFLNAALENSANMSNIPSIEFENLIKFTYEKLMDNLHKK